LAEALECLVQSNVDQVVSVEFTRPGISKYSEHLSDFFQKFQSTIGLLRLNYLTEAKLEPIKQALSQYPLTNISHLRWNSDKECNFFGFSESILQACAPNLETFI